jgi:translation initiation factor IF-3
MKVLRKVAEGVASVAKLEKPPGMEGRVLSILLAPSPQQKERDRQVKSEPAATSAPASNGAGKPAETEAVTTAPVDNGPETED